MLNRHVKMLYHLEGHQLHTEANFWGSPSLRRQGLCWQGAGIPSPRRPICCRPLMRGWRAAGQSTAPGHQPDVGSWPSSAHWTGPECQHARSPAQCPRLPNAAAPPTPVTNQCHITKLALDSIACRIKTLARHHEDSC